jgi:predicted nucleic acid-binding protein
MSDTVTDSSVVAKWVLPESDTAQAQCLLTDVAFKGERLIVLDLALVEVTHAIWKRFYRALATLAETRQSYDKLMRCPVHVVPARPLLSSALDIATQHRCTVDIFRNKVSVNIQGLVLRSY